MYTYLLVLLMSVLASVLASSGDRKWLLNMMLGLSENDRPVPPAFNPTWTPTDEDRSLSHASKWPLDEASDRRNFGDLYSIRGLNSDFRSDPNVEKKWSKHAKFHFSGFICCNQPPPSPHPRTIKRLKRPSVQEESLRSILLKLKGMTKSLARNGPLAKAPELPVDDEVHGGLAEILGGINYADIDPIFLPMTEDMSDNGYRDPENKLFLNPQRRGVTALPPSLESPIGRMKLPKYRGPAMGHGRLGRKRSLDPHQPQTSQTPIILVFETNWNLDPVDSDGNKQTPRSGRGRNTFKDYFRSIGGGR